MTFHIEFVPILQAMEEEYFEQDKQEVFQEFLSNSELSLSRMMSFDAFYLRLFSSLPYPFLSALFQCQFQLYSLSVF